MKRTKAFTLAEVLITLTIIGIIAALTIPTLIQSYKKHEAEAKIKLSYSLLSNALKMAEAEYGPIKETIPSSASEFQSTWVDNYILPYLKVSEIKTFPSHYAYYLNGGGTGTSSTVWRTHDRRNIVLQNGLVMAFNVDPNTSVMYILIDINGIKNPNKYGVDLFTLIIPKSTGKLTPLTYNAGSFCTLTKEGTDCFNKIMKNGWRIPDDYPVKKF